MGIFLDHKKIIYCKADGSYTKIVLNNGKSEIISRRLCIVGFGLPKENFFRCHKSYIVNVNEIKEFKVCNNQMCLIMQNDHEIMVSFRKKTLFCNFMKKNFIQINNSISN